MVQRQLGDSQIKRGKKMSLEIFYEKFAKGLAH
jgi:hypothetical protein